MKTYKIWNKTTKLTEDIISLDKDIDEDETCIYRQDTGYLDNMGNGVFEGDILMVLPTMMYYVDKKMGVFYANYNGLSFLLEDISSSSDNILKGRIIGNIFSDNRLRKMIDGNA